MTSLLSFNTLASLFRELVEAQFRPYPYSAGETGPAPSLSDEDEDEDRVRELEYFYWGLFPVY